ncbi:MAG: IclR family transcriptional regulator [Boseongicola sp. SB0664_bin_43]|uniref:IclR family transcriptional regulator n=1 Tax=Boseongicola sp. SB0664_bin_43 TaxID=2604844 RepID=A0A6B0Y3M2_9RHOB|nr:IclR family transcriptional regulator [Boseongicola sp. SB0664_bin_43]
MPKNGGPRIPTNLRAMLVLEAMGRQSGPMQAEEIGRLVWLPKQTAHRLCNTLVEEGYLARDSKRGPLRPGRRVREMASGILHISSGHIARHQILKSVADQVGETVNFVTPEDPGMSYKDRVETNWPFRIQLPVGSHVPFHCTASGKAFLATLPVAERRRVLSGISLDPLTRNTITKCDDLMDELATVARQGYALDNEEFLDAMVAVAVPVHDRSGRYFASLATHGPVQRLSLEKLVSLVPLLHDASERLTAVIFDLDEHPHPDEQGPLASETRKS